MVNEIFRRSNEIFINGMTKQATVDVFLSSVYDAVFRRGYSEIVINENPQATIYPNVCVPVVASIEFYKSLGIDFKYNIVENSYLQKCSFDAPFEFTRSEIMSLDNPFNKIIKFKDSGQVADYNKRCVDYLSQQTECEAGTLSSLIWSLGEVMDNVLTHSNAEAGYVLTQFHRTSNRIAICVSDFGIGIYNSLSKGMYKATSILNAIELSIKQGVGDGEGQGNGLYGLSQIIKANTGTLAITSGSASLRIDEHGNIESFTKHKYLNHDNQGTTVDFQLDLSKKVDISKEFSSIGGDTIIDFRIDEMEENGNVIYNIIANSTAGTLTREAGRLMRNDVINTMKRTGKKILLDFTEVDNVSSSFIDEFLAKLLLSVGTIGFTQMIQIIGMNDTIKHLADRSIYMRIYEGWKENLSVDE